jgi:hypothetical protein
MAVEQPQGREDGEDDEDRPKECASVLHGPIPWLPLHCSQQLHGRGRRGIPEWGIGRLLQCVTTPFHARGAWQPAFFHNHKVLGAGPAP